MPLPEQDRGRWDRLLIRRGLAALARAEALGGAEGAYALQAALAACHARARRAADTDWGRIAGLYDRLRGGDAVAGGRAEPRRGARHGVRAGGRAGAAGGAQATPALRGYAPLPAARGDFLLRAGRPGEARAAFERAAALTRNERERAFLLARAAACGGGEGSVKESHLWLQSQRLTALC